VHRPSRLLSFAQYGSAIVEKFSIHITSCRVWRRSHIRSAYSVRRATQQLLTITTTTAYEAAVTRSSLIEKEKFYVSLRVVGRLAETLAIEAYGRLSDKV
jgi:hypothetical protein